jgi:tetratricopeptide (TPR) repeat protein
MPVDKADIRPLGWRDWLGVAVRRIGVLLGGVMLFAASPAAAADALKFGPAPSWVVQQAVPPPSATAADQSVAILLHDQQVLLEPDKTTTYVEAVFKIQKPEGLAAGNLSVAWDPASDTLTVNKLEIRRGDQVIDVLKSGQTFTTMRRESNLEIAMLDGVLTANIQPEGLQEGDVVVLATTTEHVDAALRGHVETRFAPWGSVQIGLAHARLEWAPPLNLKVQKSGDLPVPQQAARNGHKIYELTMRDVQPVISPKSAPLRFSLGRLGEATDFSTWSDAARIMIPLYRAAAVIPATGPLRDEVEKIRKASADPRVRAEQALALVQQRTRYVALLMGQGGYVPAPAETTWSRRFGDCKAKTALLFAILHELGVQAEPVAVNPVIGDAIAERLPQIGLFNHVLVRAHVGGKDYWLDGTRTGDLSLDRLRIPEFGWGLPIVDNAALVHIVPPPLAVADSERRVAVDASAGVYAPAKIVIEELYRGDDALIFNQGYAQLSADQRTELIRQRAKRFFDPITVDTSSVQFDQATGELKISTKGTAKLDWEDGWFRVPNASIAYTPDLERTASPQHDAPVATDYPNFETRKTTITLPKNYPGQDTKAPAAVHETLLGVEYNRSVTLTANILNADSSERTIAPEVPYKTALADAGRLKALDNDDVFLRVPTNYQFSAEDLAAKAAETPASAQEYIDRGNAYLTASKFDESISDFTEALKLDPKNVWALADRALAYLYKKDFAAAAKDIAAAEAIDPRNAVLWRAKGVRSEEQRDPASAYIFYTKSLEFEPGNTFALFRRALVSMSQHKSADALRDVNEALTRSPVNADMLALRATIHANMGKADEARKDIAAAKAIKPDAVSLSFAEAMLAHDDNDYKTQVATFSSLLEANPRNPAALVSRGQAYFRLEHYDEALADTEQALKLGYREPDVRVLRANLFMMRKDRDAVAREADAMLRENPDSDYAFVAAGKTYNALGRKQDAMKAFDRALAIKPDAYVYINRAQVRPYADSHGRLADLDAALKLDPENADALAIKAAELVRAKNYAGALELYDRVGALVPQDKDLPLQRALALYKAGRTADAEKIFAGQRAAAKTPQDFNYLCGIQATLGGSLLKSALQDCESALKLQARFSAAVGNVALIELRMGQYDAAITHYAEAIGNRPSATYYFGRAVAYSRKGDTARAQADRAEALKLDADEEAVFAELGVRF